MLSIEHPKFLERLAKLRLMDDDFMTAALSDNIPAVQKILQIILQRNDLIVVEMQTQKDLTNLSGRASTFDILAKSEAGIYYNIEIQRADGGASQQRARYHSALLDCNTLEKGKPYDTLAETYVIFITEHDIWKEGLPVYHVARTFLHNNRAFSDGSHIVYVNGAYQGSDPIGVLMADFRATDPDEMQTPELEASVRMLKQSQGGMKQMCRLIEELVQELAEERAVELAEERAIKLAEERAVKLAEERVVKTLAEGRAEERAAMTAELVQAHKQDGRTPEEIAAMLKRPVEEIKELYEQL